MEEAGMYDDSNLLDTIGDIIDNLPTTECLRPATFAATDVSTGDYVVYDQASLSHSDIKYAVKGSCSIMQFWAPQ